MTIFNYLNSLMIIFDYLNSLMIIFNYLNSLIFYSLIIVTVGFIGFSVCYSNNNVTDNVTDSNVGSSSNNVNSDAEPQTEESSSRVSRFKPSHYLYPDHELKYLELLDLLEKQMLENGVDELVLRQMVYSYSLEDIKSSNINKRIIDRLILWYFRDM